MLGFSNVTIFLAYLLTVLSAVICIVYGIYNWNRGGDPDQNEQNMEKKWIEEEIELDNEMN